jgi:hypothetical protein
MPIDHMTFDEKKELQGEPLARFTKSPEYIGYRDMIKRSIGLLNTASFDRATEHRRIEGALLQLLNIINPLPTEIPELFDQKTRGDVPRLRDGSAHNFPLEWHRRMDGLERFLKTEASRAPVRLPPGKISVSLAISEYQKQTGFQLSFVNERIVFGLPKEIVIRPGANNQLNVLMSIIDIRYTLSFGNDRRVLKIKDARRKTGKSLPRFGSKRRKSSVSKRRCTPASVHRLSSMTMAEGKCHLSYSFPTRRRLQMRRWKKRRC